MSFIKLIFKYVRFSDDIINEKMLGGFSTED